MSVLDNFCNLQKLEFKPYWKDVRAKSSTLKFKISVVELNRVHDKVIRIMETKATIN
jgi:hypothetical protein